MNPAARLQRLEESMPPAREYAGAVWLWKMPDGTLRDKLPNGKRIYPSLEAWRAAHAEIFKRCDLVVVNVFESIPKTPEYTYGFVWRNCRVPKAGEIVTGGVIHKVGE